MRLPKKIKAIPHIKFPNEAEWLAYRKGKIGASEMASALGRPAFLTKRELYEAKVNGYEIESTNAMDFGHHCEDFIAAKFKEEYGCKLYDMGSFTVVPHPEHDFLFATPDRVGIDEDGLFLLEIKAISTNRTWEFRDAVAPENYMLQVQLQMACTGIKRAYIYAMDRDTVEFYSSEHGLNERLMDVSVPILQDFKRRVDEQDPPEFTDCAKDHAIWESFHQNDNGEVLDWSEDAESIDQMLAEIQAHAKMATASKAIGETLKQKLKRKLGDASYATTGNSWVSFCNQKTAHGESRVFRVLSKKPKGVIDPLEQETEDE